MQALNAHLNHWGDTRTIEKLKASDKGSEWHIAEITNHLVDLAQRFSIAPNRDKLTYWARDLVFAQFKEHHIKEICPKIARSFERFPTLAQIFEMLKTKEVFQGDSRDPQAIKDQEESERIKVIWTEKVGLDVLPQMCRAYAKHVLGMNVSALEKFGVSSSWVEMLVLIDWKRSGFGNGEAIIRQGKISQGRFSPREKIE
jgi:hypothetical protein